MPYVLVRVGAKSRGAKSRRPEAWAISTTGQPYQPRDLDGNPLNPTDAAALAVELAVEDDTRSRTRGHTRRGRLNPT
ncbi:MAG: hypothetical protein IIB12_09800 [Chloroflexi bacterium]|nr:hypothetical protein [Chloroflexota bacterium]